MENLPKRLVDKSIEAFTLALEIYNKPTIKYRVEGFSFFICNAWELMLKAYLINRDGEQSIYYKKSKGKDRTLELSAVISKIYTDKKQPLRLNLEEIINLRNTSTHFITEDYEALYAPLFQSCIFNYAKELKRFHNVEIEDFITQGSLMLSVKTEPLSDERIKEKYPPEIARKFIFAKNNILLTEKNEKTDSFYIPIVYRMYQTNSKENADYTFKISDASTDNVAFINKEKDPSQIFIFSFSNLIENINKRIKKHKIPFTYKNKTTNIKREFNRYTLQLFIKFYNINSNNKFAYEHKLGRKNNPHTYSQKAAEFIFNKIKEDPKNIINKIKNVKK